MRGLMVLKVFAGLTLALFVLLGGAAINAKYGLLALILWIGVFVVLLLWGHIVETHRNGKPTADK